MRVQAEALITAKQSVGFDSLPKKTNKFSLALTCALKHGVQHDGGTGGGRKGCRDGLGLGDGGDVAEDSHGGL